ncbi:PDZ domain-containing protein [Paenibacillus sp. PL91]|uniref:PDZ domain-containing protein n=1 Tax=Paenibacillus sp. PL91 TaxID=2729538 RepID=UPI00145E947B|nr:PDZ domain-containing protein [Paenibacillus sp. PL91]MBC9198383.1 PDZ domain-containing protein [Paenibacillus sp. PL91]
MLKPARYYLFGLALAVACLVAAELIWLPAPIRTGSGMQWIEMIDRLFNLLALVPLSWAFGALLGMRQQRRRLGFFLLLQLLRLGIAVLGVIGACFVLFVPEKLFQLLIVIGAAAPLVFADMLLSEALERVSAAKLPQEGELPSNERRRRLTLLWMPKRGAAALLITIVLLVALLCPTGYRVMYPGMTLNMNRYAHVEGGKQGGTINGVLVFDRPAVPADWLFARLLPLYSFEKIPADEPPLAESYAQVVLMKTDANSVAAAVAMQKAGIGKGITADGVRVIAIVKDSPADQRLRAGDIIDRLNGQAVRSIADMTAYMANTVKPGETVAVTLQRDGKSVEVEVNTKASEDDPNRPIFGISVQTELLLDIPRSIDYKRFMAHIGGPSHGAMLTLALIDQLTPGGVTHGIQVAGTGTIEADGSIGLIGGIRQKAYAISRTDADVFFVPEALEEEARSGAPDLNIVPVKTIDDVLGWLAQHG